MWQWANLNPLWSAVIVMFIGNTLCWFLRPLTWDFRRHMEDTWMTVLVDILQIWIWPLIAIIFLSKWLLLHPVLLFIASFYLLIGLSHTLWHRLKTKRLDFHWIGFPFVILTWPWTVVWAVFINQMQKHDGILIDPAKHDFEFFDIEPA